MKNIYLIGFMGSGKSSLAKKLARDLNKSYIDLDQYIEDKYGMEIQEIFEKFGETAFRNYEVESLRELKAYEIIATGGGIIEREENISLMKEGVVIFLYASFEEIERRLKDDQKRPLWKQERAKQLELFRRREPVYRDSSDKMIDTTHRPLKEIVAEIKSFILNN